MKSQRAEKFFLSLASGGHHGDSGEHIVIRAFPTLRKAKLTTKLISTKGKLLLKHSTLSSLKAAIMGR